MSLDEEKEYFLKHPVYSSLPPGHVGTVVLTSKLTKILYEHIRGNLPEILGEMKKLIQECEERIRDLGPNLPTSEGGKFSMLWDLVQ